MAELARQLTGLPVHFELSIENADKPPLDAGETARRLVPPFANREPAPRFSPNGFVLTRLPTFADKASEFSGAVFAVGIDTWKRIGDAAFYPTGGLQAAIEFIANSGCQFLVFGRKAADAFDDPETVMCRGDFPQSLVKLSIPVSESRFRVDLSSSRLRRNHAPGASE